MQINITSLVSSATFDPWELSNSRANLGDNAGQITWRNSLEQAQRPPLVLTTEEEKEAFRDFVRASGGWTREEIDAWSDAELRALFVQWVAGDIRECLGDDVDPLADDSDTAAAWKEYEENVKLGSVPSRLFRHDGKLFFDLSN